MPESVINPLSVAAHPVTRVYCNSDGIICYERDNAEPIMLNQISPKRSRVAALQRCVSLLDGETDEIVRRCPISPTGVGLTYNELRQQTAQACLESRQLEGARAEEIDAKRR
jgi:hypothetical protein